MSYTDPMDDNGLPDGQLQESEASDICNDIEDISDLQDTIDTVSRKAFNLEALAMVMESASLDQDQIKMMAVVGLDDPSVDPSDVIPTYTVEGFVEGAKMILEKIINGLKRLLGLIAGAVKRVYEFLFGLEKNLVRLIESAKRKNHRVPQGLVKLGMDSKLLAVAGKAPVTHTEILDNLYLQGKLASALYDRYSKTLPRIGNELLKTIKEFDLASPEMYLTRACNVMNVGLSNEVSAYCTKEIPKDSRFDCGPRGKVKASLPLLNNRSFFYVEWDTNREGGTFLTADKIRRTKLVLTDTFEHSKTMEDTATIPTFNAEGVVDLAVQALNLVRKAKEYANGPIVEECRKAQTELDAIYKRTKNMYASEVNTRKGPISYYRTAVDFVTTYSKWTSAVQLEYASYVGGLARSILRIGARNLSSLR